MDTRTIESYDLKYDGEHLIEVPGGAELYYELRGQGPQLTIINNFFIISPLWRNFTTRLVTRNRILTYDLRNQGASSAAETQLKFESHVEDLAHLLDALDIERTYLVGTSTSTLICRDFALAHPERVKGLIMVGPIFCPYGSRRRKYLTQSWLNTLASGGVKALFAHIYPLVYSDRTIENGGSPAYLALRERFLALNSYEQVHQNLSASLTSDDDPKKLERIVCPTLLLAGEADFLTCPSSLAAACRLLPAGGMQILDFSGHIPYFEATAAFEAAVQSFIDAAERR